MTSAHSSRNTEVADHDLLYGWTPIKRRPIHGPYDRPGWEQLVLDYALPDGRHHLWVEINHPEQQGLDRLLPLLRALPGMIDPMCREFSLSANAGAHGLESYRVNARLEEIKPWRQGPARYLDHG